MAIATNTKKPSGLEIEIKSGKIVFKWKKGETYGEAQQLQYRLLIGKSLEVADSGRNFLKQKFEIEGIKWTPITVSKTVSSNNDITFTPASYYPTVATKVFYGIEMRVRGKASQYTKNGKTYKPDWSGWTKKTLIIYTPPMPTITAAWDSGSVNDTVFTLSASSNSQSKPLYNLEYQSIKATSMVAAEDLPMLAGWSSATSVYKNTSATVTETDTGHVGTTFGRVSRVRACGAGGVSEWAYAFHQFAEPWAPVLLSAVTDYDATNHIARVTAEWDQQEDVDHPVDKNHLYYRIGVPGTGMAVTSDNSWVDAEPSNALPGRYKTAVNIAEQLSADECMWIRISAEHDSDKVYSNIIRSYTGKLAAPTGITISNQNSSTHKIDVAVTNNSTMPDSKVAIIWQPPEEPDKSFVIGVLAHGSSSISGLQCPNWGAATTLAIRAYAFVGSETYTTDGDGVKHYTISSVMESDEATSGGSIPLAPATVTLSKTETGIGIAVAWSWSWGDADSAEVAWSTNPNALQSTQAPETFTVSNIQSPILNIDDLEEGQTYYVWVRLIAGESRGPWSSRRSLHLSAAPAKPALNLSTKIVPQGESVTASWKYISQDDTPQAYAVVAEYVSGAYVPVAETDTLEHVTIPTEQWANGTTHLLALKVVAESGMESAWSGQVKLTVANAPTATITQTSLYSANDTYELRALPLTVTATGAGTAGTTELRIVRASDFTQDRPDESEFNGFAGEVILRREYRGTAQQTIAQSDLDSYLDDTAEYTLIATVTDEFGQRDSDALNFTVNWTTQAVKPTGSSVTVTDDVAYITVAAPSGTPNTSKIDIYRLSIDKPELIYRDAAIGNVIVDPYPAMGGGYRICLKTANGDYTTADGEFAWIDIDNNYDSRYQFIDFDGNHLGLRYNVELNSSWSKDFQLTKYLGGNQRGDWLAGVGRTGSMTSVALMEDDVDDRHILRILADYSGPAHIRSKDGSSFWCNVDASVATTYTEAGRVESITLNYTKTDMADLDGIPQSEWEAA